MASMDATSVASCWPCRLHQRVFHQSLNRRPTAQSILTLQVRNDEVVPDALIFAMADMRHRFGLIMRYHVNLKHKRKSGGYVERLP